MTQRFKQQIRTTLIVLVSAVLTAAGTTAKAQKYRIPQAQIGWQVVTKSEPQLVNLSNNSAPNLPRWISHGPEDHTWDTTQLVLSEASFQEQIRKALKHSADIVNRYLPYDFTHDFQLWIFREVPYVAKTLDPHIILATRLIQSGDWEKLPFVLAHEMHHLALMKANWPYPKLSERESVLGGLLTEGTATWMSVESGLFPTLNGIFQDPKQLRTSFDQVRQALSRTNDGSLKSGSELYHQNKWGYYVGCWMIHRIEEEFGRKAWLTLLEMSLEKASVEMVRLYLLTAPPPEYIF